MRVSSKMSVTESLLEFWAASLSGLAIWRAIYLPIISRASATACPGNFRGSRPQTRRPACLVRCSYSRSRRPIHRLAAGAKLRALAGHTGSHAIDVRDFRSAKAETHRRYTIAAAVASNREQQRNSAPPSIPRHIRSPVFKTIDRNTMRWLPRGFSANTVAW